MAKTKNTPAYKERMRKAAVASRKQLEAGRPQNKRKHVDDDDDTTEPLPKRPGLHRKGPPGHVAAVHDASMPDSHDEEEAEDETPVRHDGKPDTAETNVELTRLLVWQHEMQNTAEKELEQTINEARQSTIRALRSAASKKEDVKSGNEATDKGNDRGGQRDSGKKAGKATGKKADKATGKGSSRSANVATSGKRNKGKGKALDKTPGHKKNSNHPHSPNEPAPPNCPKPAQRQSTTIAFPIRRILGERKRQVGAVSRTEYLVDWQPTWSVARVARGGDSAPMNEWDENKAEHTFERKSVTVLKVHNPTSDASDEQARLMIETILAQFKTYMEKEPQALANKLFKTDEWHFLDSEQEDAAKQAAPGGLHATANKGLTALRVIQRAFMQMLRRKNNIAGSDFPYDHIVVRYAGTIDRDGQPRSFQPSEGQTVRDFLTPLFSPLFFDDAYMKYENWDKDGPFRQIVHLRVAVEALVASSPFILNQTWPLMFISLFFDAREIKNIITDSAFALEIPDKDRWENSKHDELIYKYMGKHHDWDRRAMDDVYKTFQASQIWIDDQVKVGKEIDEAGEAGQEGDADWETADEGDNWEGSSKVGANQGKSKGKIRDKGKAKAKGNEWDNGEGPSGTQKKRN